MGEEDDGELQKRIRDLQFARNQGLIVGNRRIQYSEIKDIIDEAKKEFQPVLKEFRKELHHALIHTGNSHSLAGQKMCFLIEKWFGS